MPRVSTPSHRRVRDGAVSPVIGVVLMVAVTVVLAASVGIWVRGVSDTEDRFELVTARATGGDRDGDGRVDHIKIQLIRSDDGPITFSTTVQEVSINGHAASGNFSIGHHGATASLVCTAPPSASAGTAMCGAANALAFGAFGGADKADTVWDVGQVLFAPCFGDEEHGVTVHVLRQVVYDGKIRCGEATGS